MADTDFEFDEFFDQMDGKEDTSTTMDTSNTSNTRTTNNTLHPFSVRLDQEYVELIKALAWWKRISQRELIENRIKEYLTKMEAEELSEILEQYQNSKN